MQTMQSAALEQWFTQPEGSGSKAEDCRDNAIANASINIAGPVFFIF
jgi:hypothetical protein